MAQVRIGTSGWLYPHWRGGAFYPAGLKQREEFAHYASTFDTVEINGSFYRVPVVGAPERWREQAPPGFLYAWKYPRWLTHYYKLKDPQQSYKLVFGKMDTLGPAEGPALFQLHPNMEKDYDRLARALDLLPRGKRTAWEFRHPSWYADSIFRLLRDHDAALCISDHRDAPAPWETPASWVYVRGHGPGGGYSGRYSRRTLENWADQTRRWKRRGKDVFCYFDNDIGAAAPKDALALKRALAPAREKAKIGR